MKLSATVGSVFAVFSAVAHSNAQDAPPPVPFTDLHPPPSYLESFVTSGPIVQATHILLFASFAASVFVLFRRVPSSLSLALALGPFIFGALAMWLTTYGLVAWTRGDIQYEGDIYSAVAALPRPFQLGFLLSAAAFILRFFRHALSRHERSA